MMCGLSKVRRDYTIALRGPISTVGDVLIRLGCERNVVGNGYAGHGLIFRGVVSTTGEKECQNEKVSHRALLDPFIFIH